MTCSPLLLSQTPLRAGDIIVWRGTGFIASLVRVFTLSDWHHIGVVLPPAAEGEGFRMLEAAPNGGVQVGPLAPWLPAHRICMGGAWTAEAEAAAMQWRGLPYSYVDGVRAVLRLRPRMRGMQCAELVRAWLGLVGVFVPDDSPTPDDIVFSLLSQGFPLLSLPKE